jgi:hypothetical protein
MSDTPRVHELWEVVRCNVLERQNAELLAALKEIKALDFARSAMNGAAYKAHCIADEAIRRAEG